MLIEVLYVLGAIILFGALIGLAFDEFRSCFAGCLGTIFWLVIIVIILKKCIH